MSTSIEQERALGAWKLVKSVSRDKIDGYASLAKSAPVMILTNGLGQTLAYFLAKAKGKNEYSLLSDHLDSWVLQHVPWSTAAAKPGRLIERFVEEDSKVCRMATEEALAFLSWIKRFAAALVPEEKGNKP